MTDRRLRIIALFASLCLFLSIVELMIPKPIPFFRLGLANLPILLALLLFSASEVFLIIFLKVLGQGIVSGTLISYVFLFSAAGSFAGGAAMLLLRRFYGRWITLVGISLAGALASNVVQLFVSYLLIFGESTLLIAPLFLIAGSLTGLALGFAAETAERRSRWMDLLRGGGSLGTAGTRPVEGSPRTADGGNLESGGWRQGGRLPLFRLAVGLMLIPPFILQSEVGLRALQLLICITAASAAGRRFRLLPGALIFTAVVAAHVLMPVGQVLFELFDFPVTRGALDKGVHTGLSIVGLVYISRFAVSKELYIPGTVGNLLYDVLYFFEELTAFAPKRGKGHAEAPKDSARLREKQKGRRLAALRGMFGGLFSEIDEFLIAESGFELHGREEPRASVPEGAAGAVTDGAMEGGLSPMAVALQIGLPLLLLVLQWTLFLVDF